MVLCVSSYNLNVLISKPPSLIRRRFLQNIKFSEDKKQENYKDKQEARKLLR